MGLGNVISQTIMEKRTLSSIDWPRVTRLAAYGYLFTVFEKKKKQTTSIVNRRIFS